MQLFFRFCNFYIPVLASVKKGCDVEFCSMITHVPTPPWCCSVCCSRTWLHIITLSIMFTRSNTLWLLFLYLSPLLKEPLLGTLFLSDSDVIGSVEDFLQWQEELWNTEAVETMEYVPWSSQRLCRKSNLSLSLYCFFIYTVSYKNVAVHLWSQLWKILMDFNNFYIYRNKNEWPLQVSCLLILYVMQTWCHFMLQTMLQTTLHAAGNISAV